MWRYRIMPRRLPKRTSTRGKVVLLIMLLFTLFVLVGCTSLLPMTGSITDLPEDRIQSLMERTGVTREQILDPTIHRVDEEQIGCWELVKRCWSGMPWYLQVLGSIPMACTTVYQWPDGTKSATINYCWWTDPLTMRHERQHAKGEGHEYW